MADSEKIWAKIAARLVAGLAVQPRQLVEIVFFADQLDFLEEISLAVELAGATPLVTLLRSGYLEQLLANAPLTYIQNWDKFRSGWLNQVDCRLFIQGERANFSQIPQERTAAWFTATHRLTEIEESRKVPILVVAWPVEKLAAKAGLTLAELEELVLPALSASIPELQAEIAGALAQVSGAETLTVRSGQNCELTLSLAGRSWLSDDGYVDESDRRAGAICSNLPAGSIYTTVVETATTGSIYLPQAAMAREVILHFEQGRVVAVEAAEGAAELQALFDSHSGEPRRVSHIGVGLNPYLSRSVGSIIIDEHVYGNLFLALGENRYMGGQNESSLNIDFVVPEATLLVDGKPFKLPKQI